MKEIRTIFGPRRRSAIAFDPKEGMTKSDFKDECDINSIMRKYHRTGMLPTLAAGNPQYGDFTDVPTYMEALERVRIAEEAFMALPAVVREECGNDPAVFLERVKDPQWALDHRLALPPSAVPKEPATGMQEPVKGAATQPGGSFSKSSKSSAPSE